MRILYYSPHPALFLDSHAGYGVHIREMIAAMRGMGHEVEALIMGGTEGQKQFDTAGKKPGQQSLLSRLTPALLRETLRDQRLLRTDAHAAAQLEKAIHEFKPDLVYERAAYMQTSGVDVCTRLGVKHFLEINSPYIEERVHLQGRSLLLTRARRAEKTQLTKSAHIFCVSSILRDYFIEHHHIRTDKFTVVPNAVNPAYIEAARGKAEQLRKQYSLHGKTVIGFSGSLQRWHGIDSMLDAFVQVRTEFPETVLLVIGDEGRRNLLLEEAARRKLSDQLIAPGSFSHAEVFAWMLLMDIALVPGSRWYMSPIKLFEYGACGCAIVAADAAPVREVLHEGTEGFITEPSSAALAAGIIRALRDPRITKLMAERFQEKVLAQHTWEMNAKKVIELV